MKKYDKKNGFSIAEMMIALLVISIIMAASMPIITKRSKSSVDKTWRAATNGSDAYFGLGPTQGIVIGTTEFPTGNYAKFLINTDDSANTTISHMLFSSNNTILAKLRFAPTQFEFGNNAVAESDNATAIGHNTNAGTNSTAIGANATANNTNATALGLQATATAANSTALGFGSIANVANATAVGHSSRSSGDKSSSFGYESVSSGSNSTAAGTLANATGNYSTSLGYNTISSGSSAVAIGSNSKTYAENALAVGHFAYASKKNSSALGNMANATGEQAVAIGHYANAPIDNSIALGRWANTYGGYALMIGNNLISVDSSKALNFGVNSDSIRSINIGLADTSINIKGIAYNSSDIRKKDITGEYKSGLDDIMKLKTYEFTYKDDTKKIKRVGVIAQELQTVFPNAVKKDDDGFLSIRKEDMFYAVINAIKEISLKITALQKENLKLKHQVEELSKRVEALENAKVK